MEKKLTMDFPKASVIFKHIENERYTDDERRMAIKVTLSHLFTDNGIFKSDYRTALKWLLESTDKQDAQKVETVHDECYTTCFCPRCSNDFGQYKHIANRVKFGYLKYCDLCGQRLDWSELEGLKE